MTDENDISQDDIDRAIDESAAVLRRSLLERVPAMLNEHRELRLTFEARLAERWGPALNLFEIILVTAQEAGDDFNERHRPQAAAENDYVFEVLTRLHARACLTASEVLTLLRSGHADGAMSRWRTIHELAAVSFFIAAHGQDVAERFLLHEAIESYRAAEEYQQHHAQLGQTPFSQAELDAMRQRFEELQASYGDTFPGKYGWASEAIRAANPDFRGRVTFEHIEQAAGISHLRPYYRMASHPIHAGPKGAAHNLGVMPTQQLLLAGPSNTGLADPGHCGCISLCQCTTALLNYKPDFDWLMTLRVLQQFVEEAGEAFLTAQRQLEEEERAYQASNRTEGS